MGKGELQYSSATNPHTTKHCCGGASKVHAAVDISTLLMTPHVRQVQKLLPHLIEVFLWDAAPLVTDAYGEVGAA